MTSIDPTEAVRRAMQSIGSLTTYNPPAAIPVPGPRDPRDGYRASDFRNQIVDWITDFDASLDDAHEVGFHLVSFGPSLVFHLTDIGFSDPQLISFFGHKEEDEQPVQLIQHVSQISVLLVKVKRADPSEPKRRIGFIDEAAAEGDGK